MNAESNRKRLDSYHNGNLKKFREFYFYEKKCQRYGYQPLDLYRHRMKHAMFGFEVKVYNIKIKVKKPKKWSRTERLINRKSVGKYDYTY